MARFYHCFATQEERDAWEKEQKSNHPNFKVCMRMPVRHLEREMGMPPMQLGSNGFKFATIYRFKED